MSLLGDIKIISLVADKILSYTDKNKVRTNNAMTAIQAAWTRTYDYLNNQDGEYIANQELSDLWNQAANSTRLVNVELAEQLTKKSRFWIHPNLPRQDRIIKLVELTDEMEKLNLKFKK